MAKQVQILYQIHDEDTHSTINSLISFLHSEPNAHHITKFTEEENVLIMFTSPSRHVGQILDDLESFDVGTEYGASVVIIHLQSVKPRLKKKGTGVKQKEYRLADRVSTEEIYQIVDNGLHLTFDFLTMITVASIIAGVGLASNSAVLVVAAMVISPLMGPILGLTFGAVIYDKEMVIKSIRNEVIGVLLTLLIGIVMGCSYAFSDSPWDSQEMISRGLPENLIPSVVVAIPSGAGVAISIVQGGAVALVGIAISVALLPPVVNSGMNLSYGIIMLLREYTTHDYPADFPKGDYWLWISLISFILFFINLVCIFLTAMVFFKIKDIKPPKRASNFFTNSYE